jgi:hypothetical protein
MKKLVSIVLFACAGTAGWAQDQPQDLEVQYNPNSLNPIPVYEQLYKVRVWRNVDLREKQNKGFFARNGELSKLVVDAVKSGELTDVYQTDSLVSKVSKEDFLGRLTAQQRLPIRCGRQPMTSTQVMLLHSMEGTMKRSRTAEACLRSAM